MKVIELLIKISKRDKSIRNLRFEFLGQKYFIEDFKIYDVNEYGFKNQLLNIIVIIKQRIIISELEKEIIKLKKRGN